MADLQFLFPGHPLVRGPGKGGGGGKPSFNEYNPGLAQEYLDNVNRLNPFGVASWLWKKETGNIADVWKAGALSDEKKGATTAFLSDYGEEELEDLPGGSGFKQNINPVDWLSDPGKQIQKTLNNSWETIADWDDFKQRTKREMWMGKKEKGEYVKKGYMTDERSPFYVGDNEDYKEVVANVAEFMGNNKSSLSRNGNHRKATMAMGEAINNELSGLERANPNVFDDVEGGKDAVKGFSAQMDVVQGLADLDGSLGDLNDELSINFLTTSDKGQANAKVSDLMNLIDGDGTAENPGLLQKIAKAEAAVGAKELAPVKSYVQNLKSSVASKVDGGGGSPYAFKPSAGNALQRTVAVQRGRLFRNTADEGVGGRYHNKVVRHSIYNSKSKLNEVIYTTRGVSKQGKNVGALMRAVHRDYDWQTAMDLVNAWDDGKIIDQYLWNNLVRPRIERWTPSYWVKKGVERTNYFGLTAPVLQNKMKVKVPGMGSVVLNGGAAFGMDAETLKGMLESPNLVGILKGDAVTAKFLKDNRKRLGLGLGAGGVIAESAENRAILQAVYGRALVMKNSRGFLDPGLARVSIMGKYNAFLNRVQSTVLVRAYNVVGKLPEVALQKLYVAFGRLLEWALGSSTSGIGLVIAWVARILFAKLAKKLTEFSKDAFKALRKGDISVFFEGFEGAYYFILKLALWVMAPFVLAGIIIVVLVGGLLTTIPTFDSTRVGGNVVGESIVNIPIDPVAAAAGGSAPAGSVPGASSTGTGGGGGGASTGGGGNSSSTPDLQAFCPSTCPGECEPGTSTCIGDDENSSSLPELEVFCPATCTECVPGTSTCVSSGPTNYSGPGADASCTAACGAACQNLGFGYYQCP